MFEIIKGLPSNVLGISARGKVTDADYRKFLIPQANKMLRKNPSIRLLYVAGKGFKGYDMGAAWDDTVFGLKHWDDFSAIAIVTDVAWLRAAVSLVSPFFPGTVKKFRLSELAKAKAWISESPKKKPAKKKTRKRRKSAAKR